MVELPELSPFGVNCPFLAYNFTVLGLWYNDPQYCLLFDIYGLLQSPPLSNLVFTKRTGNSIEMCNSTSRPKLLDIRLANVLFSPLGWHALMKTSAIWRRTEGSLQRTASSDLRPSIQHPLRYRYGNNHRNFSKILPWSVLQMRTQPLAATLFEVLWETYMVDLVKSCINYCPTKRSG